jgi:hypothetical protein
MASTLERIALDETAVGTMAIEWMSQRALGRAEEECLVATECDDRKSTAFWSWMGEGPTGDGPIAIDSAEFGGAAAAGCQQA